jgi:DNA (cytosine-5)-methyltransferase 1
MNTSWYCNCGWYPGRCRCNIRALDLFAGTGWGVALKAHGIRECGVEIMPEAQASRAAAGMETIYADVWDGLLGDDPHRFWHALQIASPPCQSFSLAGKGAGRAALDDVLRAIDDRAYRRPERLRALGAETDDRTALVLTPLAHVFRDRPLWVAWEQVPPVLPVWEACAEVLRGMGYSVWVGILRSEQYGVPQTRRRAVLIARADGVEAAPPTPTHSRYYEREPQRLDEGVLPWVSMAEALGFGDFVAEKAMGKGMVERYGDRPGRDASQPAFTVRASAGGMEPGGFVLRRRGLTDRPAPTITGGGTETGGAEPIAKLARYTSLPSWVGGTHRLSPAEAAALQSYPVYGYAAGFASVKTAGTRPRPVAEPAATVTGRATFAWEHGDGSRRPATPPELALLQAFPEGFHFAGNKGKQFLQIGNAVPPLMGGAIIDELLAPAALRVVPEAVAA